MTNTCEKTHQRWRGAPLTQLHELVGDGPILILAPHADDETIGCGGLILQARRAGVKVVVEFLTDGSRSHTGSSEYSPARLAALRRTEAIQALSHLGVDAASIHFWLEEDSRLPSDGAQADALAEALRQRIVAMDAGAIFVTWTDDPHCDHKAAFALAVKSIAGIDDPPQLYAYPVWSWTIETPKNAFEERVVRLDIGDDLARKREALAYHASQLGQVITDDPDGFSLSPSDLALFMQPYETFIKVAKART